MPHKKVITNTALDKQVFSAYLKKQPLRSWEEDGELGDFCVTKFTSQLKVQWVVYSEMPASQTPNPEPHTWHRCAMLRQIIQNNNLFLFLGGNNWRLSWRNTISHKWTALTLADTWTRRKRLREQINRHGNSGQNSF